MLSRKKLTVKRKRGRPSLYNPAFHPGKEAKLALMGLIDVQMTIVFDLDERTLNRWKIRYPDFCLSIKKSKDLVDEMVKDSLLNRAIIRSAPKKSSGGNRLVICPFS